MSEADLSRRGCGAVWAPHLLLSGEQETMGPTGEALLREEIIHVLAKVLHRQPVDKRGARHPALHDSSVELGPIEQALVCLRLSAEAFWHDVCFCDISFSRSTFT